ncbi:hypothetical protein [Mesorhizobium sp. M0500]|uniref:hypothetical protein n=1 Tax=Mesorhizobium sp. M0500 TaxID=2956953 RepID=UPI00333D8791
MTAEQKGHFLAALDKLEIQDEPTAVAAAMYHYFSNSIGGLNLQIVIPCPRKAWIRYMTPWATYLGIAASLLPATIRRTMFSISHPRNSEPLCSPRLDWVLTGSVADGHLYDEGYFYEYDHDLRPDEGIRWVESSPEFVPDTARGLNPEILPEARWLKGGYNFSVDYLRHSMIVLHELSAFTRQTTSFALEGGYWAPNSRLSSRR